MNGFPLILCVLQIIPSNSAASSINQRFAYAKTKPQIICAVTAQLISTFVFATRIGQSALLIKIRNISSLQPTPVAVQPGLCQTLSESTSLVFSRCGSSSEDPAQIAHDLCMFWEYFTSKEDLFVIWILKPCFLSSERIGLYEKRVTSQFFF